MWSCFPQELSSDLDAESRQLPIVQHETIDSAEGMLKVQNIQDPDEQCRGGL